MHTHEPELGDIFWLLYCCVMVTHLFYGIKKKPSNLFTSSSVNVTKPSKALHIEMPERHIVLDLVTRWQPHTWTPVSTTERTLHNCTSLPPHVLILRVSIPFVGQAMREK